MSQRDAGVTFDLVPDDDAGAEAHPAVDHPDVPALADPVRRGSRLVRAFLARQPRRRLVAVTASLVVVAASAAVATVSVRSAQAAAVERDRVAALLASPGGVRDLGDGPLEAAWTTPLTGALLGALPGTLVVADGGDVVGIRVADGDEAWRHDLGGQLDCGALGQPGERAPVDRTLVCLAGPPEARRVTVLDAAGAVVARRSLGDTSGLSVLPMAAGGLLTVQRTGPAPSEPLLLETTDLSEAFPAGITSGQGARLDATDAATGAARWTVDVPFEPVPDAAWCGIALGSGEDAHVNRELGVTVFRTLVQVSGCGVQADLLPDGTPVAPDPAGGSDRYLFPDPDGGYATNALSSTLYDERGDARPFPRSLRLVFPQATDGQTSQRLALDASGRLVGLAANGDRVWPTPDRAGAAPEVSSVLVRAGGTVLGLTADTRTLVAQRVADGAVTWRVGTPVEISPWDFPRAVTDGRVAVLDLTHGDGWGSTSSHHLVGVDLTTGDTWTVERPLADSAELLVVDGRLVEYASESTTVLRGLANGETAFDREGTITLLEPAAG